MELLDLEVQKREVVGKSYVKKLRNLGLVPGVIYGMKKEPLLIQLEVKQMDKVFKSQTGENTILKLKFMGDTSPEETAMIQEIQKEVLKPDILHIDFKRLSLEEKTEVSVPLYLVGDPAEKGGLLEQPVRELEVECMPLNIPQHINLDLSSLKLGDTITAGEVKMPEGVTCLNDPDEIVLSYNEISEEDTTATDDSLLFPQERAEPERIGRKSEEED